MFSSVYISMEAIIITLVIISILLFIGVVIFVTIKYKQDWVMLRVQQEQIKRVDEYLNKRGFES
jgi:hypothetical protein